MRGRSAREPSGVRRRRRVPPPGPPCRSDRASDCKPEPRPGVWPWRWRPFHRDRPMHGPSNGSERLGSTGSAREVQLAPAGHDAGGPPRPSGRQRPRMTQGPEAAAGLHSTRPEWMREVDASASLCPGYSSIFCPSYIQGNMSPYFRVTSESSVSSSGPVVEPADAMEPEPAAAGGSGKRRRMPRHRRRGTDDMWRGLRRRNLLCSNSGPVTVTRPSHWSE